MSEARRTVAAVALIVGILLTPLAVWTGPA